MSEDASPSVVVLQHQIARDQFLVLGRYFHKFDAVIVVVLAVGIIWFIWSHWQNRVRTAQ